MNRSLALVFTLLLLPIATPSLGTSARQNSVESIAPKPLQSGIDRHLETSHFLAQSDANNSTVHFQQALEYFKQKKNDLALVELNKAIELDSTNKTAYMLRATIYVTQKQWKLALPDLDRLIILDPELAMAHYGRGLVRFQLGSRSDAIADLKTAAQLYREQKDPDGYQKVTEILEKLEK
jgi:tetratricopeptide (TPR) repeat protein